MKYLKNQYNWNECTIEHFKFISTLFAKDRVLNEIKEIVKTRKRLLEINDKDLVNDLFTKVYSEKIIEYKSYKKLTK